MSKLFNWLKHSLPFSNLSVPLLGLGILTVPIKNIIKILYMLSITLSFTATYCILSTISTRNYVIKIIFSLSFLGWFISLCELLLQQKGVNISRRTESKVLYLELNVNIMIWIILLPRMQQLLWIYIVKYQYLGKFKLIKQCSAKSVIFHCIVPPPQQIHITSGLKESK